MDASPTAKIKPTQFTGALYMIKYYTTISLDKNMQHYQDTWNRRERIKTEARTDVTEAREPSNDRGEP